ncbi:MAG: hypothetical protein MUE42_07570 [Opitutaceae bacterium]|jgi:hypothetical protein|nr:hypothetical protein [Opitutaceae bacterium]
MFIAHHHRVAVLAGTFAIASALSAQTRTPPPSDFVLIESGGTFSTEFVNVAAAANGAVAFGDSEYGTPHFIPNINDGRYGNSYSWLAANVGTVGSYEELFVGVGVVFSAPADITSLALGRDNTGQYTDRADAEYRIQYSTTPIAGFNPATAVWNPIGVIFPLDNNPSSIRRLYSFGAGVISNVTAVRILTVAGGEHFDYSDYNPETEETTNYYIPYAGQAIDELEVYSTTAIPEPSAFAGLAGLAALAMVATRRGKR